MELVDNPDRPRRPGSACGSRRRNRLRRRGDRSSPLDELAQGEPMSADILVVDDEADIRDLVAGILEDEGHRTRTAGIVRRGPRGDRGAASAPRLPRHLAAGQPPRRPAGARARQERASRSAGGHDLGPRQHRDGGLGHQGRRLRLHREAVQGGPARARRRAGARSLPPEARGARPARRAPVQASRIAGHSVADQPAPPDGRAGRADQCPHPRHRRAGLRQGARGAHDPRASRRARAAPSSSCRRRRSRRRTWRRNCSASRATDGKGRRVGALEEAHGGTLYIDEIADMPRETQNRILRVLVDQNFQRVGGTHAGPCRRAHHLLVEPRPAGRDRRRPLPRGSVPPPRASCRSASRPSPSGARTCRS